MKNILRSVLYYIGIFLMIMAILGVKELIHKNEIKAMFIQLEVPSIIEEEIIEEDIIYEDVIEETWG